MTVANVSANKISTIPRQCHPAAITQIVMDGLCCPLGDATRSKHGQRPRLLVMYNTYRDSCIIKQRLRFTLFSSQF